VGGTQPSARRAERCFDDVSVFTGAEHADELVEHSALPGLFGQKAAVAERFEPRPERRADELTPAHEHVVDVRGAAQARRCCAVRRVDSTSPDVCHSHGRVAAKRHPDLLLDDRRIVGYAASAFAIPSRTRG
jgi:hypothetical protein